MDEQAKTSIVRIHRRQGDKVWPIGCGFLVSGRFVLTCRHVVKAALDPEMDLLGKELELDFPFPYPRSGILKAKVSFVSENPDLARLQLLSDPPKKAIPMPLSTEMNFWGHTYHAFGINIVRSDDIWCEGKLISSQSDGTIQMENVSQFNVREGFSGTAVWDADIKRGVGMIVSIEPKPVTKVAYAIPMANILEKCPDLEPQDAGSSGVGSSGLAQANASNQPFALSSENPFRPLNCRIDDPSLVFGRESNVNSALSYLKTGSSVVFIGDHGSGRSSILTLLLDRVSRDLGWKTARLNLQLVEDEETFYEALCDVLGVAEARIFRLPRALFGQRILLALDEMERMTKKGFTRDVRDQLRGLAEGNDAPLKLAMVTSTPLDGLFPDSFTGGSPLALICQQIRVDPWDFDTARRFLLDRLKEDSVTFSESEMEQLIQRSGGMPRQLVNHAYHLYLQKLGQEP